MTVPKLKRIKISTEMELKTWLSKDAGSEERVMIVTCDKRSPDKHISSDRVRGIIAEEGWTAERSYTLIGNLQGLVARRP